jgi:hypothetical protein
MAIMNILQTFGIFYDHLVHFVLIWKFFPVLEPCTEKNLATLVPAQPMLFLGPVTSKLIGMFFLLLLFLSPAVDIDIT